eukprot:TRINITY_DN1971_c0_g1_i1.p1 TRINITY_DN1971_c0_g1~~TRINITY_DN1971_c0_g1_i1.p1  ORF type:complete len:286 (-),score=35.13 TRINITY_DN1971_c0_g1_i1:451-1308(-)
MFWDLNLVCKENWVKTRDMFGSAVKLGFGGVAINVDVQNGVNASHVCPITDFNMELLWTAGEDIIKQLQQRQLVGKGNVGVKQLKRITIEIQDVGQGSQLQDYSEVLRQYDLIAVKPTNNETLQQACQQLDVDIVTLDLSGKLLKLRAPPLQEAVKRGVVFEVLYRDLLEDVELRKDYIGKVQQLIQMINGKGVIISSGAKSSSEMRSTDEIIALSTLFNLSEKRGREAISKTCEDLIERSREKRGLHQALIYVQAKPQENSEYENKRKQTIEALRKRVKARVDY